MSFENLNYVDLLIHFRQLKPIKQAIIAGSILFIIHIPYAHFLLRMSPVESVSLSLYSAIMFMVVYYFTSVFIMKKTMKHMKSSQGPKKGLRNK